MVIEKLSDGRSSCESMSCSLIACWMSWKIYDFSSRSVMSLEPRSVSAVGRKPALASITAAGGLVSTCSLTYFPLGAGGFRDFRSSRLESGVLKSPWVDFQPSFVPALNLISFISHQRHPFEVPCRAYMLSGGFFVSSACFPNVLSAAFSHFRLCLWPTSRRSMKRLRF